jgi:8-oxo-dGTP diphosphatase
MMQMTSSHFCLNCGNPLEIRPLGGRKRQACPACGWIYYPSLNLGAGVLIEQDEQLLLLRRSIDPFRGCWNLPAGYVEVDEPPKRAAEREALEEAGLRVRVEALVDAYFFDDDPRGNGVLLVYRCTFEDGSLCTDDESAEARFFARADLPAALAGGGHNQAINAWRNASNQWLMKT